jgi:hypothetical protein
MRKLAFSAAIGTLLVVGPAAYADDELISIIQATNASANTMTLLNNTAYKLPDNVKASDLKRGQVVRITFKVGVATATSVLVGAAATGTVRTLDEEKGTITLDDGKTYFLLPIIDLEDVKVGKRVRLEYAPRQQDNAMMVANVRPAG